MSVYKTDICWYYKDICMRGEGCTFAHGEKELRSYNSEITPEDKKIFKASRKRIAKLYGVKRHMDDSS